MIDYHLHTGITIDATGTMEDYCKKAVILGFKHLCFTNHMEMDDALNEVYDFAMDDGDIEDLLAKFNNLKPKYPVDISFGVELGYQKKLESEIKDFSLRFPFDFVLGAVHKIIEGKIVEDMSKNRIFDRYPAKVLYERYFKLLDKAIRTGIFDCMAHFDVVKRISPPVEYEKFEKHVISCVESLAEMDVAIELNTRDASKGIFLPSKEILKLCFDSGVKKVTIGSDSHSPENLGTGICEGFKLLKQVGYKQVCIFKQRKPIFLNIP